MDALDDLAQRLSDQYHADLERVVIEAVCGGQHGVLVQWTGPTSYRIEICPAVPYGNIYERRSYRPAFEVE